MMLSQNFISLSKNWPILYEYASKAELYIYSDPHAAVVKLRCYVELLVGELYRELRLCSPETDDLFARLMYEPLRQAVPRDIMSKFHAIRKFGNSAAHGEIIAPEQADILIHDAYLVGRWFYSTLTKDNAEYPEFIPIQLPASYGVKDKQITAEQEQALRDLAYIQAQEKQAILELNGTNITPNAGRVQEFIQSSQLAAAKIDMHSEATSQLFNFEDAFADYTLSSGQNELVKRLDDFLKGKNENIFLLKGYAGTGKTFITKGLVDYFKITGRNFVLAAPTGKAAKVISKKAGAPAYTIHKTIYAFDKIKEYTVEDIAGTETFKFYAELAINTQSVDTVYIVDEVSMISDKHQEAEFFRFGSGFLLKDFFEFVNIDHNDHRKKVIFIGDDAQLPPVGMNFSPALSAEYLQSKYPAKITEYMLTEVVRQKSDSGILQNANELRTLLDTKYINHLEMNLNFPDVHEVKYEDLVEGYLQACGRKINDDAILIMHSNADVKDYNDSVREKFFPGYYNEIRPGDKIMANNNNSSYGFFISNGDFGIVRNVLSPTESRTITLKRKNERTGAVENIEVVLNFRDVNVGFRDNDGQSRFFDAKIIENLLYNKERELSSDENKALYIDFIIRNSHLKKKSLEFRETLKSDPYFNALKVKFGYAITCHKAQGSEWKHVFVKCKNSDTGLNHRYLRWLYTAITRAVDNLYLTDPPDIKLGGGIKQVSILGATTVVLGNMLNDVNIVAPTTPTAQLDCTATSDFNLAPIQFDCLAEPTIKEEAARFTNVLQEAFGISNQDSVLLNLLELVQKCISLYDIQVVDIKHNAYQEAYFFQRGDASARVNIAYNGKGEISSLKAPVRSDFAIELLQILDLIRGKSLSINNTTSKEPVFAQSFLQEFHNRLSALAAEKNIAIQNVESLNWMQRYTFARGSESVVFDIWYDGKQRFTKCQAAKNAYQFPALVEDVSLLLTEGLSK